MKIVAKERKNTAPKELVRRGSAEIAVKAKQQIIEASRGGQTEEQDNQQTTLEMPSVPRPHGTKKVKETKTKPKTRENYIENLQNRQGDIPEAFRNKHTTESVDIKPATEINTEPVIIPKQGSQALAESQGRNAARKKMVQKRAARNKTTPTDPESVGVSLSPKEAKTAENRHTDGKSAGQLPRTKESVLANTPKQPTKTTVSKARVATPASAKDTAPVKSTPKTVQATTPKTAKVPKVKEPAKTATTAVKKPTQASIAVQKAAQKAGKNASKVAQKSAKQAASAALKAVIAAVKSLIAALGAGGFAAVAIILVLVLVGGILASPLGIFFSNSVDNELTLQRVMGQINTEFSQLITDIENAVPHDDVEQTGRRTLMARYSAGIVTAGFVRAKQKKKRGKNHPTADDHI